MEINGKRDVLTPLQRAVYTIKEIRAKLDKAERKQSEPIAVIGMGCRFPGGADNPDDFWSMLNNGIDAITEVPLSRWNIDALYDSNPDAAGKMYSRYGGFLRDIESFDPEFFGISPREAVSMDPQQRLLLEVSWEALEHAGQVPEKLKNSNTGVFVGIGQNDYSHLKLYSVPLEQIGTYDGTGNGFCFASGRLSYVFGLNGPNLAIDTACSSSLVAIHLACQSLRIQECDLAVVGAVQLMASPQISVFLSRIQALSPDGRCKAFDASANGFGRSEGCGVVILKRLSDAIVDRNNIVAVIRGSAINHDGPSSGLTVPNELAQEKLIRQAIKNAKVKPDQVDYIETHGTGTALGDPIEANALQTIFSQDRTSDYPLVVGSVKTNLGHLEAAAGMASLIKVLLSLQHEEIPPHLHFQALNPHISWDGFPVHIPTDHMSWLRGERTRIAGISSFGMSGTNAHVVIEEAPELPSKHETSGSDQDRPLHLITLSAKTDTILKQIAQKYKDYLSAYPDLKIEDIGFSANTGRSHFPCRAGILAASSKQLKENLARLCSGQHEKSILLRHIQENRRPKVVFLFTGQGSQYVNMGKELYETHLHFRKNIDYCDEVLRSHLGISILEVLYPKEGDSDREQSASVIDKTIYTQAALFVLEYALAQLWRSWGIEPEALIGHSLGEYVAATVAGVFSLDDGLFLVASRARLMQSLKQDGAMAAVFADENRVAQALKPYEQDVSLASINGPKNVVISGRRRSVEAMLIDLKKENINAVSLNVSHAFHSPLMEPMLEAFENIAKEVDYASPKIPIISNYTGEIISDDIATPAYWCTHIRYPVRFASSIEVLFQKGYDVFLEVGPKPVLLGIARYIEEKRKNDGQGLQTSKALWLPSLRQNRSDWQQMLTSLAELYGRGVKIDWHGFDQCYPRRQLVLPTYPFQRNRYWVEQKDAQRHRKTFRGFWDKKKEINPLLGKHILSAMKEIQFESVTSQDCPAFLTDHRVLNAVVFPATGYIEIALSAGEKVLRSKELVIEGFEIHQPLIFKDRQDHLVQTILSLDQKSGYVFNIFSLTLLEDNSMDSTFALHASGKIFLRDHLASPLRDNALVSPSQSLHTVSIDSFYKRFQEQGIDYGPSFRTVALLRRSDEEAFGHVELQEAKGIDSKDYTVHPTLIDGCLQVIGGIFNESPGNDPFLPVSIERIYFIHQPATQLRAKAVVRSPRESIQETVTADLTVHRPEGLIVAAFEGVLLKRAQRKALVGIREDPLKQWLYEVQWQHKPYQAEMAGPETEVSKGLWIILCDKQGIGKILASALAQKGELCQLVIPGSAYCRIDDHTIEVNTGQPGDFKRLLEDMSTPGVEALKGVLYLWSLDATDAPDLSVDRLNEDIEHSCQSALYLVQALFGASHPRTLRFSFVTRGVHPIGEEYRNAPGVSQSLLWGMRNVIAQEHPELFWNIMGRFMNP